MLDNVFIAWGCTIESQSWCLGWAPIWYYHKRGPLPARESERLERYYWWRWKGIGIFEVQTPTLRCVAGDQAGGHLNFESCRKTSMKLKSRNSNYLSPITIRTRYDAFPDFHCLPCRYALPEYCQGLWTLWFVEINNNAAVEQVSKFAREHQDETAYPATWPFFNFCTDSLNSDIPTTVGLSFNNPKVHVSFASQLRFIQIRYLALQSPEFHQHPSIPQLKCLLRTDSWILEQTDWYQDWTSQQAGVRYLKR